MDEAFRRLDAVSEAKQVKLVPPTKLARGGAFVEEFKQAARKILEGPERRPESSKGTRLAKLPCFPFAAAHGHQRREYWKNGLGVTAHWIKRRTTDRP